MDVCDLIVADAHRKLKAMQERHRQHRGQCKCLDLQEQQALLDELSRLSRAKPREALTEDNMPIFNRLWRCE